MDNSEKPAEYPPLRLVRDPEIVAIENHNVRVIEAYRDELLVDETGKDRDEAIYNATPFRNSVNTWSHVRFRRQNNGYALRCFGDNRLTDVVYEVTMRPYHEVQGAPSAPDGADWFIEYGPNSSDNNEWGYSFDPADFRYCLEEIWGQLPRSTQDKIGIDQRLPRD